MYVFGLKLFVFSLGWTNGALPVGITDQLLLQVLFDDSPDILQKSDNGQIFHYSIQNCSQISRLVVFFWSVVTMLKDLKNIRF